MRVLPRSKRAPDDPPKNRDGVPPSKPQSPDVSGSPLVIREGEPRMSEDSQQSNKPIWLAIALVAATLVALAVGVI
jgi:hypothetical protein